MTLTAPDLVLQAVDDWLRNMVLGEALCPFAGAVVEQQALRLVCVAAVSETELLEALAAELRLLQQQPEVETTLLIHPQVLTEFTAYNQFLDLADGLLAELALTGEFQVASFHPEYQYAGTQPDDAQNYCNRAPYPLLHLLRESSVSRAVAAHPDVAQIPERNIAHLEQIGAAELARRLTRWQTEPAMDA